MEKICPLCNALEAITANCPYCGKELMDRGPVEDYLGPYSPYMDADSLNNFKIQTHCVHLFVCPLCSYDTRITLEMVDI